MKKEQIIKKFIKSYENFLLNNKVFTLNDIPFNFIDYFIEKNHLSHHYYNDFEQVERKILKKWNVKFY